MGYSNFRASASSHTGATGTWKIFESLIGTQPDGIETVPCSKLQVEMKHGHWLTPIIVLVVRLDGSSQCCSTSLGPIQLRRKRIGSFVWQAIVYRATGIAESKEISEAPCNSMLHKLLQQTADTKEDSHIAWSLFRVYPEWLCRPFVSFGLLKSKSSERSIEIHDRFFGCKLLTFGTPIARTIPQREESGSRPTISSFEVSIPITGGHLCRQERNSYSQQASFIVCTLTTHREQLDKQLSLTSCRLETQLVSFRPVLTGEAPVSPVRSWLYLLTQSTVHAYVTWRFHRRCWSLSSPEIDRIKLYQQKNL